MSGTLAGGAKRPSRARRGGGRARLAGEAAQAAEPALDARGLPRNGTGVANHAGARDAPFRDSPLRLLVVSHNCVGESNRRRVEALAQIPGLEARLLTPRWWFEEGRRIVVQPREADRAARDGGYHWRLGRTLWTNNGTRHLYLDGLLETVRAFRPHVIDLHEEPFSLVALQTLLARGLLAPRAALVFCSYVNVPARWNLPYRLVERATLALADAAYAPNQDVPGVLRAKGMRGPVRVIPSGVDVARFATVAPSDLGQRLGGAARPYVGFLGRLEPVKGLDVLVDACAWLRNQGTIVVAGDGPERAALEHRAAERRLGERVRFLPGMPFGEVPGFLRALDGVVLPSITIPPTHKEQFGRVLTEAMAAGVPVVGSSSGAIPEVIGDAGLVVPERNPRALAEALDRLLGDAPLRQALAEKGRRRVEAHYAWPVVARQAVDLYLEALERRCRGAPGAARAPLWKGRGA